jgi:tRNA G46 methylase TrmB
MNEDSLTHEAQAFDEQIEERLAAGYVPDLRQARECNYFYNNSWRHPDYIKLDFVEQFNLIHKTVEKYKPCAITLPKILEIGCGPGHMSLELARNGFDFVIFIGALHHFPDQNEVQKKISKIGVLQPTEFFLCGPENRIKNNGRNTINCTA